MKSNIFIPKSINVGYQTRSDTYTKKLAYVIYYDEKGKLRKEASWNSWRDDKIEPQEFTNEPTSGFVLNKKVGDYSSGWEHRKSYVRIYDPRNFEFEITIENLLYILENTSSIKGKGLEGEFVYGWDGKDLVLIPTESPDYKSISEYNDIVHNNQTIKAKDLIVGATYLTKDNRELVYIGKFDYYSYGYRWIVDGEYKYSKSSRDVPYRSNGYSSSRYDYDSVDLLYGKYFWFASKYYDYKYVDGEKIYDVEYTWTLSQNSSITNKFIKCVDEKCTEYYSDIFERLESCSKYSPIDESKNIIIPYILEEFLEHEQYIKDRCWGVSFYDSNLKAHEVRFNKNDGTFYERINENNSVWNSRYKDVICTLEEFYNKVKPIHLDKYLTNGRFYGRSY